MPFDAISCHFVPLYATLPTAKKIFVTTHNKKKISILTIFEDVKRCFNRRTCGGIGFRNIVIYTSLF